MPCKCKNNITLNIVDKEDFFFIPVKTVINAKYYHETNHTSSGSCCIYGDPSINGGELKEEDIIQSINNLGAKVIANKPKLGDITSYEITINIVMG